MAGLKASTDALYGTTPWTWTTLLRVARDTGLAVQGPLVRISDLTLFHSHSASSSLLLSGGCRSGVKTTLARWPLMTASSHFAGLECQVKTLLHVCVTNAVLYLFARQILSAGTNELLQQSFDGWMFQAL